MSESNSTQFRDNGAIGALLDEYERSIVHLVAKIKNISDHDLTIIVDMNTKDEDCKSIQTILTHVVRAGYAYATYIRNHQGENLTFQKPDHLDNSKKYIEALKKMFQFTEQVFHDFPSIKLEEKDSSSKMLVSWGQLYDVEQLMEQAIVHILRHRRQIERFIS